MTQRISDARDHLAKVRLTDVALLKIAEICAAFEVDGLRADIVTARTAVAHAAWEGRDEVTRADIRRAALLSLPHRRRRNPFDAPGLDEDLLDQLLGDDELPPEPPERARRTTARARISEPDRRTTQVPDGPSASNQSPSDDPEAPVRARPLGPESRETQVQVPARVGGRGGAPTAPSCSRSRALGEGADGDAAGRSRAAADGSARPAATPARCTSSRR